MPYRPKMHKPRRLAPKMSRDDAERKAFYNRAAWLKCRRAFLDANPVCVDCLAQGKLSEATTPHHAIERKKRPDLAYDHGNLVALCASCHSKRHKAAKGQT